MEEKTLVCLRYIHLFDTEIRDIGSGVAHNLIAQRKIASGQTLFIDAGAVVYACVTANDASHIKIPGRGILDNSHNKEQIFFEAAVQGSNILIQNVSVDGRLLTSEKEFAFKVGPFAKNVRYEVTK